MSLSAIEARTLALARVERAAGAAFGCEEERPATARTALVTPTTIALATLATALAATLTYLV